MGVFAPDEGNQQDEVEERIKVRLGEIREKAKELVAEKGYYPYLRRRGKYTYMTIRKGDHEISLGPYDPDYFAELKSLLPASGRMPRGRTLEAVEAPDYGPPLGRPRMPTGEDWRLWAVRFGIRSSVIFFYEHATQRGYNGSLADFINDVVELFFEEHGKYLAIVDRRAIEQAKRLGFKVIGA